MTCAELHTPGQPAQGDYMGWCAWADSMSKTHRQVRCPMCGLFFVWVLKKRRGAPRSVGAVDPHVASTGKPSTRDAK
jgi:hypothetical protein